MTGSDDINIIVYDDKTFSLALFCKSKEESNMQMLEEKWKNILWKCKKIFVIAVILIRNKTSNNDSNNMLRRDYDIIASSNTPFLHAHKQLIHYCFVLYIASEKN